MSSPDLSDATGPAPSPHVPDADPSPGEAVDRFARWRHWTRPALVANLVGQIVIIVTGGAVRLTSSGLGCDQWPLCEPGSFTPRFHEATTVHPYIEFGNRTLTGVLVAFAALVAWLVWTDRGRAASYRRLGFAPLVGVGLQAVIGGVVVLLELSPAWVGLHYLVSAGLVWVSALLLYRHGEGDGAPTPTVDRATTLVGRALAVVLLPVLALGVLVTGSGPHGGDDEVAYRFAFDPVSITRLHSGCVWLFVALAVALAVLAYRRPAPERARRAVVVLLGVTLLQGAIGYAQYFTGLPVILVGLHMLGSALLIASATWTVLTLRERDR